MTFSTSEVAVCCSKDSVRSVVRWRSSFSSRVFSMAMGLIGEDLERCDLSLSEELRLDAAQRDHSNCNTFSHQRDVKAGTEAHASCVFAGYGKFVPLGLEIKKCG